MSQTLNLPEVANLWDVSVVPTIVATQRGARKSFQKLLASKGVEVVEFDILNPRDVMEYFYDRGYLSILWECGGTLAASAISSGTIHKVMVALVAFGVYNVILDELVTLFSKLYTVNNQYGSVYKKLVYPHLITKVAISVVTTRLMILGLHA